MAKKTKDMLTNTSQSFTACEDLFNNAMILANFSKLLEVD